LTDAFTPAWRRGAAIVFLFTAVTILLTYPVSMHLADRVLSDVPDTWLVMWSLAWDTHAFTHRPWAIFDANMYYPLHNTLAFSENFIGSALLAAPIIWITSNLVLALNVVSLLTVMLCGVGAYRLGRAVGLSHGGAIVCGMVFAFSPPRFLRVSQLHLAAMQWIPFALASLYSYFEHGRRRDLQWAAGFAAAQALTSGHGAVFLAMSVVLLVLYRIVRGAPVRLLDWPRDLGVAGAVVITAAAVVFVPYLAVQREFGFRRGLGLWEGIPPTMFLASPSHLQSWILSTWLPDARINETAEAYLFPGFLPILLAGAALIPRGRSAAVRIAAAALELVFIAALACAAAFVVSGPFRIRSGDVILLSVKSFWRVVVVAAAAGAARAALAGRVPIAGFSAIRLRPGANGAIGYGLVLVAISIWMMIGPPFGLWPHVYSLPAFSLLRMPSRFIVLAVLGLAILAGTGADRLLQLVSDTVARRLEVSDTSIRQFQLAGIAIVSAALVAEFACIPLWNDPLTVAIPAADRWLASRPTPFVVAEVPVPPPRRLGASERRETMYMVHSTAHWQRTVHGYSGFRLQMHTDLYDAMTQFPDAGSLGALEQLGVNYVVMHLDLYDPAERDEAFSRLKQFHDRVRLVYADDNARVFMLSGSSKRE